LRRLTLVIITQKDSLFIPKTISSLGEMNEIDIKRIVILDTKGTLENKKGYFIRLFGLRDSISMALKYVVAKTLDILDSLARYKLLKEKRSVRGVAKTHGIPLTIVQNINSDESYTLLKREQADLYLSFSAPQVFKKRVLDLPKYGVLNVHGSFLPKYRGIMPSFWALVNGEEYAGATVHRMAEKIDEGEILIQEEVDIRSCRSVYDVISRTKEVGSRIVRKALIMYSIDPESIQFIKNNIEEGSYYSWPQPEDVEKLHNAGKRLA